MTLSIVMTLVAVAFVLGVGVGLRHRRGVDVVDLREVVAALELIRAEIRALPQHVAGQRRHASNAGLAVGDPPAGGGGAAASPARRPGNRQDAA